MRDLTMYVSAHTRQSTQLSVSIETAVTVPDPVEAAAAITRLCPHAAVRGVACGTIYECEMCILLIRLKI